MWLFSSPRGLFQPTGTMTIKVWRHTCMVLDFYTYMNFYNVFSILTQSIFLLVFFFIRKVGGFGCLPLFLRIKLSSLLLIFFWTFLNTAWIALLLLYLREGLQTWSWWKKENCNRIGVSAFSFSHHAEFLVQFLEWCFDVK